MLSVGTEVIVKTSRGNKRAAIHSHIAGLYMRIIKCEDPYFNYKIIDMDDIVEATVAISDISISTFSEQRIQNCLEYIQKYEKDRRAIWKGERMSGEVEWSNPVGYFENGKLLLDNGNHRTEANRRLGRKFITINFQ